MKTEDLISAIAADNASVSPPIGRAITAAFGAGITLAVIEFAAMLNIREDFASAITSDPRFIFKFVFTLGLAIPAAMLVSRLARPEGADGWAKALIAVPLALLAVAVGLELMTIPKEHWAEHAMGSMPGQCMRYIPLLSIAPFIATFAMLRYGAPSNPVTAGAAAGLVSSSIAAALYASYCVDDSPLFVAIWYIGGITLVTALGALMGKYALRW